MNDLKEFKKWLDKYGVGYWDEGRVLRFKMFNQNWEVWENRTSLEIGQLGVSLGNGYWQSIAEYLVKYSLSSECQLKRIADALEEMNEKGMVTFDGGDIDV